MKTHFQDESSNRYGEAGDVYVAEERTVFVVRRGLRTQKGQCATSDEAVKVADAMNTGKYGSVTEAMSAIASVAHW